VFPEESEKRMASSSYDTHIRLWDVRQKSSYALLKHHSKQINWLDISPDGCFLLSSSEDCTTKFWDLRATEKVLSTYAEHSGPVLKAMFNPEDCLFASCSTDRTVKYFNCDEGKGTYAYVSSTEPVSAPITAIDFSLDGALVCSAGNNCLQIWDMRRDGLLL
jgi:WD40 repeat protein